MVERNSDGVVGWDGSGGREGWGQKGGRFTMMQVHIGLCQSIC